MYYNASRCHADSKAPYPKTYPLFLNENFLDYTNFSQNLAVCLIATLPILFLSLLSVKFLFLLSLPWLVFFINLTICKNRWSSLLKEQAKTPHIKDLIKHDTRVYGIYEEYERTLKKQWNIKDDFYRDYVNYCTRLRDSFWHFVIDVKSNNLILPDSSTLQTIETLYIRLCQHLGQFNTLIQAIKSSTHTMVPEDKRRAEKFGSSLDKQIKSFEDTLYKFRDLNAKSNDELTDLQHDLDLQLKIQERVVERMQNDILTLE